MNYHELSGGYIEVICGPMFAGKTQELIRIITRLKYAKREYRIFKPTIDNRYKESMIISHSNHQAEAINISKSEEIYEHLTDDVLFVIIDEVQFFDNEILKVVTDLANNGYKVICAGLDCDFKGEPFGVMPDLLAIADDVKKLTAICISCGSIATKTQRIINSKPAYYDDAIVQIGAKESYEARCRKCHVVLKRE